MKYSSYTKVSLIFQSSNLDNFDIVSKCLSLEPTEFYNKGDTTKYGNLAKLTVWKLEYPISDAYEGLDEKIEELMIGIKDKKSEISKLIEMGFEGLVSIITYKSEDDDVGLDLELPIIKTLNDLNLSLHFNVYNKND